MSANVSRLEGTEYQRNRSFSPAVVTEGGKVIWLAGQTATADASGKDISGQFEEQAKTCFDAINATLARSGGDLSNIVWMTVFIKDPRNGDAFVKLRSSLFQDGRFPASTLVTISNFARPGMEIEIQAIAVV
jgi:enamine deaminase RidA (YjgF/YER057c/UK114 family)